MKDMATIFQILPDLYLSSFKANLLDQKRKTKHIIYIYNKYCNLNDRNKK